MTKAAAQNSSEINYNFYDEQQEYIQPNEEVAEPSFIEAYVCNEQGEWLSTKSDAHAEIGTCERKYYIYKQKLYFIAGSFGLTAFFSGHIYCTTLQYIYIVS